MYSSRRKSKRSYRKRVVSRKNKSRSKRKNLKFRKMRGGGLTMDEIKKILLKKGKTELVHYINGIKYPSLDYTSVLAIFKDVIDDTDSTFDNVITTLEKKMIHNREAAERLAAAAEAKAAAAEAKAPAAAPPPPPAPAPSILYINDPILSNGQSIGFTQNLSRSPPGFNQVTQLFSVDGGKTYKISQMEHNSTDPYPDIIYHLITQPNVVGVV